MNRIMTIINGVRYEGSNVSVIGNKVFINGQDVTPDAKQIDITIEGNCDELHVDSCRTITVKGNAGLVKTVSGDVNVEGDVRGSVSTVSGDVDANKIEGSTSTVSGDIKTRK